MGKWAYANQATMKYPDQVNRPTTLLLAPLTIVLGMSA